MRGNLIGTNPAGTSALANGGDGVRLVGQGAENYIGCNENVNGNLCTAEHRNVISGNSGDGVEVNAPATIVQGNFIGTNAAGTAALPNGAHGVQILGGIFSTIGPHPSYYPPGVPPGVNGNVISGNVLDGVHLESTNATSCRVFFNAIGTNASGTGAVANGRDGVLILNGQFNTIGDARGNLIAGNTQDGVDVSGTSATGNTIGYSGIGGAGPLRNGANGVLIQGGADNTTLTANTITNNALDGVRITGAGTTGNLAQFNTITSHPGHGVQINTGAASNTIRSNTISNSTGNGVTIQNFGSTGNLVESNVIQSNAMQGVLITLSAQFNTLRSTPSSPTRSLVWRWGAAPPTTRSAARRPAVRPGTPSRGTPAPAFASSTRCAT